MFGGGSMRKEKRGSLVFQTKNILDSKLAIGHSKHYDKTHGGIQDKIYSWSTYRAYLKHCGYFVKYCKEKHGCRIVEDCQPYVDEWLENRQELSAYTQKLEASALAKLFGCTTKDFIQTASRERKNITRSRGEKVRDKHFSEEKNADFVEFCRSTGLRRAEISALTGDKLFYRNGKPYISVSSGSKGGRYREVPVIGNTDVVVRLMRTSGSAKVWDHVPSNADVHSYRSDYATALYDSLARPIDEIPFDRVNKGTGRKYQSEVYICRGDRKGEKFDKVAMLQTSKALGHNRISVIAGHYIRH